MDDLVTALKGAMNKPPVPDDYLDQLLEDAADEIERLRAALKEIMSFSVDRMDPWYEVAEEALR